LGFDQVCSKFNINGDVSKAVGNIIIDNKGERAEKIEMEKEEKEISPIIRSKNLAKNTLEIKNIKPKKAKSISLSSPSDKKKKPMAFSSPIPRILQRSTTKTQDSVKGRSQEKSVRESEDTPALVDKHLHIKSRTDSVGKDSFISGGKKEDYFIANRFNPEI